MWDLQAIVKAIINLKDNNLNEKDCIMQAQKFDKRECFKEYILLYEKIFKNEKE